MTFSQWISGCHCLPSSVSVEKCSINKGTGTRFNQQTHADSMHSINGHRTGHTTSKIVILLDCDAACADFFNNIINLPYQNASWCPWWHYSTCPNLHQSWWRYMLRNSILSNFFWMIFSWTMFFFDLLEEARRKCGKIEKRLILQTSSCFVVLFFVFDALHSSL